MRSLPLRAFAGVAGVALAAGLITACNPLNNTRPGPPSVINAAEPEWFSCGTGPFGLAVRAYGMNDDRAVCDRAVEAAWEYSRYADLWGPGYQATVVTRTAGTWQCGEVSANPVPYQECSRDGSPVDLLRLQS